MSVIEGQGSNATVRFGTQPRTYTTLTGSHYDRLRNLVVNRFKASEEATRSRWERFYRYEKILHMLTKKQTVSWKANAFLPYGLSLSEQSAAIKWLALFMTRPFVTVEARRGGMDEIGDIAMRRQALLDWRLNGDVDAVQLGMDMFRQSERYGKSIAVCVPRMDRTSTPYRGAATLPAAMGGAARLTWKTRDQFDYRIHAEAIDMVDFRPEPGRRRINGIGGMRWCGRVYWLTLDELRGMEKNNEIGPVVGGQMVKEITDTEQPDTSEYKYRRMLLGSWGEDLDRYIDPYDRPVRLSEACMYVPEEAIEPGVAEMEARDGLNPYKRLVILANDRVVLQDVALPWDHGMWPYIEQDCVPDPHDFWGKGKIEPNEHAIYASNEILNNRLDNLRLSINGLLGIWGDKMEPGWRERLMSQPYGVIETLAAPREVMQRIELGDVTKDSYQEQQELYQLMQEASAVNETMVGGYESGQRTLGEHVLKMESASKRLQFELVGAAYQLLGYKSGLSRFILSLDRQYLPIPTYVDAIMPDGPDDIMQIEIGPRTLMADDKLFTYLPTGATEGINIQAKRADIGAMLQAIQPFVPAMAMMGFNFAEMVKTILKVFGHDPNRYFPKIQGAQDIGMAQQAGGGQPGMGMPPGMPGMAPGGPMGGMGGGMMPGGAPPAAGGQAAIQRPGAPGFAGIRGRVQVSPQVLAALGGLGGRT